MLKVYCDVCRQAFSPESMQQTWMKLQVNPTPRWNHLDVKTLDICSWQCLERYATKHI